MVLTTSVTIYLMFTSILYGARNILCNFLFDSLYYTTFANEIGVYTEVISLWPVMDCRINVCVLHFMFNTCLSIRSLGTYH